MAFRLTESIQAMGEEYPQFVYNELRTTKGCVGTWRGWVQPIKSGVGLLDLLDDLAHDRDVFVIADEVRHYGGCEADHCRHQWMEGAQELQLPFEIEVRYDGGLALPRAYVISPPIPAEKRLHMWADGALCAFLASESVWIWHTHTATDLVRHALIWLVKWSVFARTGVWIGAQHGNTAQYHLSRVRPRDPCWCGSGHQYRKCHRKADVFSTTVGQPASRVGRFII